MGSRTKGVSNYESAGHIAIVGTVDGTYSCEEEARLGVYWILLAHGIPFCKSVEGLVSRLCNDGHLVTADCIYETATLNYSLGSNENKVDHVHAVRDSRVQDDGTWYAGRREHFSGLDATEKTLLIGVKMQDG